MPVYIGKSGDLVGCYRCLTHSLTHSQTTEYRATQLVSSIKFKLSHAMTHVHILYFVIPSPVITIFLISEMQDYTIQMRDANITSFPATTIFLLPKMQDYTNAANIIPSPSQQFSSSQK